MRKLSVMIVACLLSLPLGGCVTDGRLGGQIKISPRVEAPKLPEPPSRYAECRHLVPVPDQEMSDSQLVAFAARLRKSEVGKSRCLDGLLNWYAGVARAYGPK